VGKPEGKRPLDRYTRVGHKTGPSTATIDDLLCIKRPLGRPRHRLEGNIETDFREIEWCGMDWIHLA
jgi:hypothetical protein